MSQHAFLAPSSAHRWSHCPGSALMESRHPEQGDKAAADEGDAAHWCMRQLFDGWAPAALLRDGVTERGHPVTVEMIEAAQLIYDDVRATLGTHPPVVEQPLQIPRVHPSACWGTPDVRAAQPSIEDVFKGATTLYLWDFKYGHKFVEVFENRQLITYAAGYLDEFLHIPHERITIVFRIVQPRSYHRDGPIREWRTTAAALRPHIERLQFAADDAMSPQPVCKPQPSACENCTARHACEPLQRAAYRGMDLALQAQALELTPAALGLELRYLKDAARLMEARTTGLQAQAEALMRQGASVPHWRMAPGQSRRKWSRPASEVIALGSMMGLPLAKEPEAVTPTQAKAAGLPAELVDAYSFQPPAALQLAVDDGTEARKVFSPGA